MPLFTILWESCYCIWNSSEILFGCVESAHIMCQAARSAQEKLEFIFDIEHYLSTEISKHSKRNLKPFLSVLHFFSEVHSIKITYVAMPPSPSSWSFFHWLSQSSQTIISSSYLALQSRLPAMDKRSDLYIQRLRRVCSNSSSLGKVNYR